MRLRTLLLLCLLVVCLTAFALPALAVQKAPPPAPKAAIPVPDQFARALLEAQRDADLADLQAKAATKVAQAAVDLAQSAQASAQAALEHNERIKMEVMARLGFSPETYRLDLKQSDDGSVHYAIVERSPQRAAPPDAPEPAPAPDDSKAPDVAPAKADKPPKRATR